MHDLSDIINDFFQKSPEDLVVITADYHLPTMIRKNTGSNYDQESEHDVHSYPRDYLTALLNERIRDHIKYATLFPLEIKDKLKVGLLLVYMGERKNA